jgi:hypothetical protein
MARTYTANFANVTVSAIQDAISILAPSGKLVEIIEVRLAAKTTTSESVRIRHRRSVGAALGSGGSVVTPAKHEAGDGAASSTVHANDTTQATGTLTTIFEDIFNVLSGYLWVPVPEEKIILAPADAYVLDLPAAPASNSYSGSVTFREVG